jgi:hypothetical protein
MKSVSQADMGHAVRVAYHAATTSPCWLFFSCSSYIKRCKMSIAPCSELMGPGLVPLCRICLEHTRLRVGMAPYDVSRDSYYIDFQLLGFVSSRVDLPE